MNQASIHIIETVLAFAMVVLLSVLLKKKGILSGSDVGIFAKLLTQVVLPAVIFFQFLKNPPAARHVLPILAMLIAGCCTLLVAWIIGRSLGFSRATTPCREHGEERRQRRRPAQRQPEGPPRLGRRARDPPSGQIPTPKPLVRGPRGFLNSLLIS